MPLLRFLLILMCGCCATHALLGQDLQDWNNYKQKFNKTFSNNDPPEIFAEYYWWLNRQMINTFNLLAGTGLNTYKLQMNQFTDMRLVQFNALHPVAKQPAVSHAIVPAAVQAAPTSYDPITTLGLNSQIEDEGYVCNAGWAYAAAKSIELKQALQTGNMTPNALSAQNFLDCAGMGTGCTTQVPQTAFDYLTLYGQVLHLERDYPNNNTLKSQGMCAPRASNVTVRLTSYAHLQDGDDASLMKYVAAGYPVVIEYNPTSFEFMHYASGIFQQPLTVQRGSHFMTVIGYGTDTVSGLDYWLLQNSFGTTWGENGMIRIIRSARAPLTKNAYFPYDLS